MTDYAAGGTAIEDSTYLTRPERWLARKRYDLIVAHDLTRGGKQEVNALVAQAAFQAGLGLATVAAPLLGVLFMAVIFLGPEMDSYVPLQLAFGGLAVLLFVGCFLRGQAAKRHIERGD